MLGWDPSSDPHASSYNVYYGTVSHQYTDKVSAGSGTTVTISGLIEGMTYYFAATTCDIANQESSFSEEIPYDVPPLTVNLSVTNILVAGQNVVFSAAAAGNGPLSYQWQFNSTNLVSATNTVLTLNTITTNQAGTYFVTVTDGTGQTTNVTVNLAVYATAAATLNLVAPSGGPYSFNVSGVPGFEYLVQATTNLTDWVSVQTNNSPFDFTDTDTNQFAQRFYRSVAIFHSTVTTNGVPANLPGAPAPPATLIQTAYSASQYSFNVAGEPGCAYIIQASTNLVDWVSVQTNLAPFAFTDPETDRFTQRFYRTLSANGIGANVMVTANAAVTLGPVAYLGGQCSFSVSGVMDYQYVVQASTNLTDWVSVQTNQAPFTFMDPDAGQFPQRFYRTF